MLSILLSIIAATVYSQPVPYTLQDLKNPQDVSAINQNFKYVTDYIKVQADAMSALPSNQSILSGNNAFTGDNSHGGKETFNSTTTINYLSIEGGPTWGNWIPVSSQAFAVAGSTMIFSGLSSSWTYHLEYELFDSNAAGMVLYTVFNGNYTDLVYNFNTSIENSNTPPYDICSAYTSKKYMTIGSIESGASQIHGSFSGYVDFFQVWGTSVSVGAYATGFSNYESLLYPTVIRNNMLTSKPMALPLTSISIFFAAVSEGVSPAKSMTGAAWLYKRRR